MNDTITPDETPDTPAAKPRRASRSLKIALVAAGVCAGAIGATALGATAATTAGSGTGSTSTGSTATSAPTSAPGMPVGPNGHQGRPADHGSRPVRADEKAVTAAQAATMRAEALKAVPGGTVYRIETDAGDGTYEAHMTKADGSEVTVKFDSSLKVLKVENGMGQGDPRPAGGPNH